MSFSKRKHSSDFVYGSLVLLFSLTILGTASAAPTLTDSKPSDFRALHDGVLIAPEAGVVYLMSPEGGIDGVDLEAGSVVWQTLEAAKPLALRGDLLVAQAEEEKSPHLEIVTLDLRRSGSASSRSEISLPKGIESQIDDSLGQSFRVQASLQETEAEISWSSSRRSKSGMSPDVVDPRIAPLIDTSSVNTDTAAAVVHQGASARDTGTVRLDLASGKIRPGAATAKAGAAESAVTSLRELGTSERLAGVSGRQFLSVDGRHILASQRRADGAADQRYRWTVYRLSSGEEIGQISSRISVSAFFVKGTRIFFTTSPVVHRQGGEWAHEPFSLRSFDLVSGVEQWSREIRDTAFRGPFPQ